MARTFVPVLLLAFALAAPSVVAAPKDDRPEPSEGAAKEPPGKTKKAAETPPADPTPVPVASPASDVQTTAPPPTEEPATVPQASSGSERPPPTQTQPAAGVAPEPDAAQAASALAEGSPDGSGAYVPAPSLLPSSSMEDARGPLLPGAPRAGAAPDESATTSPASRWSGIWWSMPLLGAAGIGVVVVLRRRSQGFALTAPRPDAAPTSPTARPMPAADLTDHDAMLRNAQSAVVRGAYAEAIAWFDAALVAVPTLAVAHFCRGVCLATVGRTAEAYGALETAVALDPSDASYRIHFARVAIALGRGTDAMAALEPVATALPDIQQAMLEDEQLKGLRDHPRFLAMCGAL